MPAEKCYAVRAFETGREVTTLIPYAHLIQEATQAEMPKSFWLPRTGKEIIHFHQYVSTLQLTRVYVVRGRSEQAVTTYSV